MSKKFLNQTNSKAALSERAGDLLIYDITHGFGLVEETLNKVFTLVRWRFSTVMRSLHFLLPFKHHQLPP